MKSTVRKRIHCKNLGSLQFVGKIFLFSSVDRHVLFLRSQHAFLKLFSNRWRRHKSERKYQVLAILCTSNILYSPTVPVRCLGKPGPRLLFYLHHWISKRTFVDNNKSCGKRNQISSTGLKITSFEAANDQAGCGQHLRQLLLFQQTPTGILKNTK